MQLHNSCVVFFFFFCFKFSIFGGFCVREIGWHNCCDTNVFAFSHVDPLFWANWSALTAEGLFPNENLLMFSQDKVPFPRTKCSHEGGRLSSDGWTVLKQAVSSLYRSFLCADSAWSSPESAQLHQVTSPVHGEPQPVNVRNQLMSKNPQAATRIEPFWTSLSWDGIDSYIAKMGRPY